jgi:hypothetical protein
MFAVAKKAGAESTPLVRLVISLETLGAVTIQGSALPPNISEFAESFVSFAIYGLANLFSGFDASPN